VNFKRKGELVGAFSYSEIIPRLKAELEALLEARRALGGEGGVGQGSPEGAVG
jgi:hypothetical protein